MSGLEVWLEELVPDVVFSRSGGWGLWVLGIARAGWCRWVRIHIYMFTVSGAWRRAGRWCIEIQGHGNRVQGRRDVVFC